MNKKSAQSGIAHIALMVGLVFLGAIGIYLIKNPVNQSSEAASNQGIFTNLSASLKSTSATFNFTYNGTVSSYIISVSTDSNMKKNVFSPFGSGTASSIIVSSPQIWDKYKCGVTVYWKVNAAVVKGSPVASSIQKAVVDCSNPSPNQLTCICKDQSIQLTCNNIDCSSSPAQDSVCVSLCSAHLGLQGVGCLTNYKFCINPTPSPPSDTTTSATKRVFVTSSAYDGNLGGLAGADQKCQTNADSVNLGGNWKAWLSSKTISAASRVTRTGGSYQLLNGTIVANNWSDLTDGTILHQIDLTETNTIVTRDPFNDTTSIWTGTAGDGSIFNDIHGPYDLCQDWTSNYYDATTGYSGVVGTALGSDELTSNLIRGYWTLKSAGARCGDQFYRLFCFEQ